MARELATAGTQGAASRTMKVTTSRPGERPLDEWSELRRPGNGRIGSERPERRSLQPLKRNLVVGAGSIRAIGGGAVIGGRAVGSAVGIATGVAKRPDFDELDARGVDLDRTALGAVLGLEVVRAESAHESDLVSFREMHCGAGEAVPAEDSVPVGTLAAIVATSEALVGREVEAGAAAISVAEELGIVAEIPDESDVIRNVSHLRFSFWGCFP